MKPQKFIKQIFLLKDEISSKIIPLLSMCNSSSILDTAWIKILLPTVHALALQFPHPKWTNKNRTRQSNAPFIALPLVVLAVVPHP